MPRALLVALSLLITNAGGIALADPSEVRTQLDTIVSSSTSRNERRATRQRITERASDDKSIQIELVRLYEEPNAAPNSANAIFEILAAVEAPVRQAQGVMLKHYIKFAGTTGSAFASLTAMSAFEKLASLGQIDDQIELELARKALETSANPPQNYEGELLARISKHGTLHSGTTAFLRQALLTLPEGLQLNMLEALFYEAKASGNTDEYFRLAERLAVSLRVPRLFDTLAETTSREPRHVRLVLGGLTHTEAYVREKAFEALEKTEPLTTEAVQTLEALSNSNDPDLRESAARTLAKLGLSVESIEQAIRVGQELAMSQDWRALSRAAAMLGTSLQNGAKTGVKVELLEAALETLVTMAKHVAGRKLAPTSNEMRFAENVTINAFHQLHVLLTLPAHEYEALPFRYSLVKKTLEALAYLRTHGSTAAVQTALRSVVRAAAEAAVIEALRCQSALIDANFPLVAPKKPSN